MSKKEEKKEEKEGCECDYPEISQNNPGNCSLNQIIKCHGEMSIRDLASHFQNFCNCGCTPVKKE
ncbi:MAG: hypothetical protein ACFFAS_01180 [Promethearchaeota archaeon]